MSNQNSSYSSKSQVEKFEKEFDVKFENIIKINIKEGLILKVKEEGSEERTIQIPFERLKEYMRPACTACSDFTNVYADISFGGLGSPEKFTTIIPRTDKGMGIISKVLVEKSIKCADLDGKSINKMRDLLFKFSQLKLKRRNNFMNNLK